MEAFHFDFLSLCLIILAKKKNYICLQWFTVTPVLHLLFFRKRKIGSVIVIDVCVVVLLWQYWRVRPELYQIIVYTLQVRLWEISQKRLRNTNKLPTTDIFRPECEPSLSTMNDDILKYCHIQEENERDMESM